MCAGVLSISELRGVLRAVQGSDFSEEAFFRWHDVHGRERHFGSGGMVDRQEFGWYVADCAECQSGKMDLIVQEFADAVDSAAPQPASEVAPAPMPKQAGKQYAFSRGGKQYAFTGKAQEQPAKTKSLLRLPTFGRAKSQAKGLQTAATAGSELSLKDAATSDEALAKALLAMCGGDRGKAEALLTGALTKLRKSPRAAVTSLPIPPRVIESDRLAHGSGPGVPGTVVV